ncbi:MAG TPA: hypothetical protein VNI20_02250, partial [Fimbriimonadaceae bacterium]|nr:hypothetical protein [Fimbriimonadaceae bacterium]
MRTAGVDLVARWRESGAWWSGEPPQEFAEWRDRRGVLRKASRDLPLYEKQEDAGDVRPGKTRDEKVVAAANIFEVIEWNLGVRKSNVAYAPLHVLSGYSFGRSVLLARELPRRAAALGIRAMAITDR